jgi:hypothetical protein
LARFSSSSHNPFRSSLPNFSDKRKFLNVQFEKFARIEVTDLEELSQVRKSILAEFGPLLGQIGPAQIELYDKEDNLITELEEIHDDYFKKKKENGLWLRIKIDKPSSTTSQLALETNSSTEVLTGNS